MTKTDQDLTMWQGEDIVITVPITNAAGAVVSLTNATAVRWLVFPGQNSTSNTSAAVLTKTLGSGIALVNVAGTNDGIRITIDTNDTHNLANGAYYHECRVVDSANDEQVVFIGNLSLKKSRTND
jgi:hypothetical protein